MDTVTVQERSKKRAFRVLLGCCIMQFCGMGTIFDSASAFFMVVPDAVGVSMGEFALWITASTVTSCIIMLFIGSIVKRIDMKIVLTLAAVISAIAVACFACANQVWHFVVIGAIIGCTSGIYFQYATPTLINAWFSHRQGFYLGLAVAIGGIGSAIWPIIFTALIGSIGYQTTYLINACIILVAILPFSFTTFSIKPERYGLEPYNPGKERQKEETPLSGVDFKRGLKSVAFPCLILACAFTSFFGCFNSYIQDFTIGALGENYVMFSATMMTSLQIGYIIASFFLGGLCDKFGVRSVSSVLLVIVAIALILFSVMRTPGILLVAAFFFGMSSALFMVTVPLLVRDTFGSRDYERFLGLAYMGCNIVTAVCASLIGFMFDATGSYNLSFYVGVAVCVFIIIMMYVTRVAAKKFDVDKSSVRES